MKLRQEHETHLQTMRTWRKKKGRRWKVLLFEDDHDFAGMIQAMFGVLNTRYFDVKWIKDEEHFQMWIDRFEPDLVLSDLRLNNPNFHGLDILEYCPDTVYRLLMTNDVPFLETNSKRMDSKGIEYVSKPFSRKILYRIAMDVAREFEKEKNHAE